MDSIVHSLTLSVLEWSKEVFNAFVGYLKIFTLQTKLFSNTKVLCFVLAVNNNFSITVLNVVLSNQVAT